MAKLIIVVALCMLAVATAFRTSSTFTMNKMEEEAMTCPTYTCLTTGGDCSYTADTAKVCPLGEVTNTTSLTQCNCAAYAAFPAIGSVCGSQTKCGPWATCAMKWGSTDLKCTGKKMSGDSCSSDYDCAGYRTCQSGKCNGNLAAGAACYITNKSPASRGTCQYGQYCPTIDGVNNRTCTAWLAAEADCSGANANGCPPWTFCGLLDSANPKCNKISTSIQTMADGSDIKTQIGAAVCTSLTGNFTSLKCVNYDTELAKWKAAFPTPATVRCTTTSDCNLPGVTLARCACTADKTGALPYCQLLPSPAISNAVDLAEYKSGGILEAAGTSCEMVEPQSAMLVSDSSYCAYTYKSQFLAALCPAYTAQSGLSYSCYDNSYGICNGASALKSSVFVTMIVALVAFFTTQ